MNQGDEYLLNPIALHSCTLCKSIEHFVAAAHPNRPVGKVICVAFLILRCDFIFIGILLKLERCVGGLFALRLSRLTFHVSRLISFFPSAVSKFFSPAYRILSSSYI